MLKNRNAGFLAFLLFTVPLTAQVDHAILNGTVTDASDLSEGPE